MGGHFVQGHVDGTGTVRSITERGTDRRLEVAFPIGFGQYLVEKGSIAVAGVSLTVAELGVETFAVWLIPHTWNATNLHERGVGDRVNLEFDILAKQVERLLRFRNLG
jgi:riboflavin synthase